MYQSTVFKSFIDRKKYKLRIEVMIYKLDDESSLIILIFIICIGQLEKNSPGISSRICLRSCCTSRACVSSSILKLGIIYTGKQHHSTNCTRRNHTHDRLNYPSQTLRKTRTRLQKPRNSILTQSLPKKLSYIYDDPTITEDFRKYP